MKSPFATTTALLLASLSAFSAAPKINAQTRLEKTFLNPPEESKPWCYWYWLNKAISKEGLTKDLEANRLHGKGHGMEGGFSNPPYPGKWRVGKPALHSG